MGRQLPPLLFGSALLGLRCPRCQQAFVRGDVVRTLVVQGVAHGQPTLDTTILHVTCPGSASTAQ